MISTRTVFGHKTILESPDSAAIIFWLQEAHPFGFDLAKQETSDQMVPALILKLCSALGKYDLGRLTNLLLEHMSCTCCQ